MLSRNASLLVLAALLAPALFLASCAKPATATGPSCNTGQTECGSSCVNEQTDSQNCGSCGNVCKSGSTCTNGMCACSSGLLSCSGSCVASNTSNCGSCGNKCSSGQVCNNGVCSSSCGSGSSMCSDGACSSNTDSAHCGTSCAVCGSGSTCNNGSCGCSVSGQQLCSGTCIDTTSNTSNCGSCGHACSSGQTCSNGNCTTISTTGTGGTTGSGGSNTGTGGSNTGTGGSNTGTGGSNTGTGGSNTGTGGSTGSGGSSTGSGGSTRPSGCPANANTISDFEEGTTGIVVPQGGRQGWWYVFSDATNNAGMSPAANSTGPITSTMMSTSDPNYATCDHWDMEVKTTAAHTTWGAGFGTSLNQVIPPPTGTTTATKKAYDVSSFNGISFNIKSASGTAPPVWFELLTLNNQPNPDGSIKTSDGTASGTAQAPSSNGTDEYNTRGMLIKNIGTSWTQVFVPFGILGPRYLPASTASVCSNSAVNCQAPPFKSTDVLGLQFAGYTQFGTSAGTFDLIVDDVALYTGSNGLAAFTKGALATDGSVGSCTKPAGATINYLTNMYANWKATFVVGSGSSTRVQRPENANDTVSEGIAYGMLLAVNFNDKTLFDNLWSYEQAHKAAGNLMTWCIPGGGGGMGSACSASGGSATDADEDMAFALLEADKQWPGGSYKATGTSLIGDIWSHDIDTSSNLPTGGSNYGSTGGSKVTNPSYFAPAYYRVFATVDTGHSWSSVVTAVYSAISSISSKATKAGLIPAWCTSNCTAVGSNGGADDGLYQYDAHRVPWRLGLDACWNSVTSASSFLSSNASFFASQASGGVGRVSDIYTLGGNPNSDAAPNSMSAIGTAGVGAMAAGNAFASTAYQFLLDASYSPASTIPDSNGRVSYSYFNATVGLLTALTMSGNFNH